jgi:hypothetical protein
MNVIKGKTHPAPRVLIYGVHGVGKSSFACSHPGTLAIDYEDGLDEIGPDRIKAPPTWKGSMSLIADVCGGPGDHKAIVIDTADKLEQQAAKDVCDTGKKKTLADFDWGQGHAQLEVKWRELLFVLETARAKGRAVILVAHVKSKDQKDPTLGSYAKYIASMNEKPWLASAQWVDAVLFCNYEAGMFDGRAIMTGDRTLYTQAGTGYDAKNRWGLPPALPLFSGGERYTWPKFASLIASMQRSPEEVIASIRSLTTAETKEKAEEFITKAGSDVPRLVATETALKKKVS